MVQAHTLHQGLDVVRPTQDIDVIVHVETPLGGSAQAADALETLGYRLQEPVDARGRTAHRWLRGADIIDVVVADHAPPSVRPRLSDGGGRGWNPGAASDCHCLSFN
jgi:hypothetical protein